MKGNIVVIGNEVMVSNNAVLDIQTDVIDTPSGKSTTKTRIFEVFDPFGRLNKNESVVIAFHSEDGLKTSYEGIVTDYSEVRCFIRINKLTEEYITIIGRAKIWLQ